MFNEWATYRYDYPPAEWAWSFEKSILSGNLSLLDEYLERFIELGRKENVLVFSRPDDQSIITGKEYVEFIRHKLISGANRRQVTLFSAFDYPGEQESFGAIVSSNVFVYDREGKIYQDQVRDLGAILIETLPQSVLDEMKFYGAPPISIWGTANFAYEISGVNAPPANHVKIFTSLALRSDLWLPIMPRSDHDLRPGVQDNSLALKHTPAFNRFLKAVHELVSELGGKWHGYTTRFAHTEIEEILTDDGITFNQE